MANSTWALEKSIFYRQNLGSSSAVHIRHDIPPVRLFQEHTATGLQFLEDLFNKEILPATEECGVFESLSSRRKYCGKYCLTTL
jgi:hypothetical protein